MKALRIVFMTVLAATACQAQRATKGSLRDSSLIVTQEQDTAAIALALGISNTWASAQAYDRGTRASEDARVEGVASNLFLTAESARHAGDTNLAAVLEITRTNLLDHYTALVYAERYARSTNVTALVDVLGSELRATSAVTRAIAEGALQSATSAATLATNQFTAIWSPTSAGRWTDGDGNVWGVTNVTALLITFSSDTYPPAPFGSSPHEFPFTINQGQEGYEGQLAWIGRIDSGFHQVFGGSPTVLWQNETENDYSYPITLVAYEGCSGTAVIDYGTIPVTQIVDRVSFDSTREYHADSFTNIVWREVWSNGWKYAVAYTNTP